MQASRQWWKFFVENLETFGFIKSKIDPCLLLRADDNGTVILCIYVDDVLCIGDQHAINKAISDIASVFSIKQTTEVREYVGCTFLHSLDENTMFLCQTELINQMEKEFMNEIKKVSLPATPLAPGESVIQPKDDSELISVEQQKKYRSGVGMLLYLVKYSRPDIANGVRELSKVMDGATPAHFKSLIQMIKFVVSMKNKCLVMDEAKIDKNLKWMIKGYCDSDYAGDKDSRISVTGFVIYVCGIPISWRSKAQKSVTLSSSEAEYVAISEVCAEILFIKQVLEFLNVFVTLPIEVMVYNIGAIFLT